MHTARAAASLAHASVSATSRPVRASTIRYGRAADSAPAGVVGAAYWPPQAASTSKNGPTFIEATVAVDSGPVSVEARIACRAAEQKDWAGASPAPTRC